MDSLEWCNQECQPGGQKNQSTRDHRSHYRYSALHLPLGPLHHLWSVNILTEHSSIIKATYLFLLLLMILSNNFFFCLVPHCLLVLLALGSQYMWRRNWWTIWTKSVIYPSSSIFRHALVPTKPRSAFRICGWRPNQFNLIDLYLEICACSLDNSDIM